jgi:membrane protein implicated in regulation of membrane protease activity
VVQRVRASTFTKALLGRRGRVTAGGSGLLLYFGKHWPARVEPDRQGTLTAAARKRV